MPFAQQPYYADGYYHRENAAPEPKKRKMFDFIATRWAKAFFLTVAVQAIICLAFEA